MTMHVLDLLRGFSSCLWAAMTQMIVQRLAGAASFTTTTTTAGIGIFHERSDHDPRESVSRWKPEFQSDFSRRMAWCLPRQK